MVAVPAVQQLYRCLCMEVLLRALCRGAELTCATACFRRGGLLHKMDVLLDEQVLLGAR